MSDVSIKKYDYIDSLRGFAILGVVLIHTTQLASATSCTLNLIIAEGARGVQLFYIASALTLFLSMSARKKCESKPLLSFFIRRFFRIAPLFYCAILVYTAYYGLSGREWAPNGIQWWYIPLTAFFMHGWHPETITSVVPGGWSIAVEMTFYLCIPFLFLRLKDIKITLLSLFIFLGLAKVLSSLVFSFFSTHYIASQQYLVSAFSFFWFFSQLPVFILGILLYHITRKYPKGDKSTANILLYASLLCFIAFLNIETFENILPKHFLYGIAFVMFSLSLHYLPRKIFVNKFTIFVGKLSFSIYLVHFGVLIILKSVLFDGHKFNGNISFILSFLLVLLVSVGVSYLSYRVVEIPGINAGKKIIKKFVS